MTKRMPGEVRVPGLTRLGLAHLANVPIMGFVGFNGDGKTLAAASVAVAHLERDRPVLSTVRLLDYTDPRPCTDDLCESAAHGMPGHMAAHPGWVPFRDFDQLFSFRDGYVLMDEVTGVADAREHAAMPAAVSNYLPQLRRRGVALGWTTIGWSFADVRIRRITRAVCLAQGFAPTWEPENLWPRNRLFVYRVYDAREFDEFDSHKRENFRALARAYYWRPWGTVQGAYDTNDAVLALASADERGLCNVCGKHRKREYCRGEHGGEGRAPAARHTHDLDGVPADPPATEVLDLSESTWDDLVG